MKFERTQIYFFTGVFTAVVVLLKVPINKIGRPQSESPDVTISEKMYASFFGGRAFEYTKCSQLGKITLAEILSSVTNSSILENPQFGRLRACYYGYCDNF